MRWSFPRLMRYVDDLFLVVRRESSAQLLHFVNNLKKNIHFRIEMESQQKNINFLDTTLHRGADCSLYTTGYQKPFSKYPRLNNFNSATNPAVTLNVAVNLLHRAINLTHLNHMAIERATDILKANNYPIKVIIKAQNTVLSSRNKT